MTARLPNLVIAGVAKGGTTSLFHYLGQHPQICASDLKELDYFAPLRFPDGKLAPIEEYEKHFTHCGGERYRMEASPSYCYGGREVAEAMRKVLDEPRLLISLRDPVRRFWSAYTFLQSMGRLDADMDALDYIDRCLQKEEGHTPLSVGRYAEWLPAWLDEFKSHLKIVFAEDLFESSAQVVADVLAWLGLEEEKALEVETHNPTVQPRNRLLARSAYQAKALSDRVLAKAPRARASLRGLYRAVNTRDETSVMPESVRVRLLQHYAAPTAELAALLESHGVPHRAAWLAQ